MSLVGSAVASVRPTDKKCPLRHHAVFDHLLDREKPTSLLAMMLVAQEEDLTGLMPLDVRPAEYVLVLVKGHSAGYASEATALSYLAFDRLRDRSSPPSLPRPEPIDPRSGEMEPSSSTRTIPNLLSRSAGTSHSR
jgi:hypothetical protein